MLKGLSADVHLAEDGVEVVAKFQELRPDLIFMDMSMPLIGGIEATQRIREMPCKQPAIVALTANAFDSDRRACSLAGMDGFLTKPVRRTQLLGCMFAHLSHSPPAD